MMRRRYVRKSRAFVSISNYPALDLDDRERCARKHGDAPCVNDQGLAVIVRAVVGTLGAMPTGGVEDFANI
jgi:hypothetical protein